MVWQKKPPVSPTQVSPHGSHNYLGEVFKKFYLGPRHRPMEYNPGGRAWPSVFFYTSQGFRGTERVEKHCPGGTEHKVGSVLQQQLVRRRTGVCGSRVLKASPLPSPGLAQTP